MRRPDGPHCAYRNVLAGAAHPSKLYRCGECDKRFSAHTNGVLAPSKLG